ncbi:MAG: hypothetical protein JJT99_03895 [Rhodobacteraceae bacterium]|nr:hypothetical protein [Paracoccaceae bacterium]
MTVLNITVTNEIAPRAILALFDGFTRDPLRDRMARLGTEIATTRPRRSVFKH